jgi:hypothetical protein
MSNPFNSGPIPDYNNPPITPEYYSPNLSVLQTITPVNTFKTVIVTVFPNEFVVGQLVRFVLPPNVGMDSLNEQPAYITSIVDSQTFIVAADSTGQNPFDPSRNPRQTPFVIPVGDVNSGQINSSGRINNLLYIPGSFINISPQ